MTDNLDCGINDRRKVLEIQLIHNFKLIFVVALCTINSKKKCPEWKFIGFYCTKSIVCQQLTLSLIHQNSDIGTEGYSKGKERRKKRKCQSFSLVRLLLTSWTVGLQPSSSSGIFQAGILEPFPSPGDLPDPGMEPRCPALKADSLPCEPAGKPLFPVKANGQQLKW